MLGDDEDLATQATVGLEHLDSLESWKPNSSAADVQISPNPFADDWDRVIGLDFDDGLTGFDSWTKKPSAASSGYGSSDFFTQSDAGPQLGEGDFSAIPTAGLTAPPLVGSGAIPSPREASADAALALFASQLTANSRGNLPPGTSPTPNAPPVLMLTAAPSIAASNPTTLPHQLVFQLQTGQEAALGQVQSLAQANHLSLSTTSLPGVYQLDGTGASLVAMQSYLTNNPAVTFVREPQILHATDTNPNDPKYVDNTLYGMNGTFGIRAPQAWDTTTGSPATVIADIDTGLDYNHPDIYKNVWINQAEIPASRKANLTDVDGDGVITFWDLNNSINQGPFKITDVNGDGRIDAGDILAPMGKTGGLDNGTGGWADGISQDGDTAHVDDLIGWNFVSNNNNPFDDNSHGTHTAGTIAAIGNNSVGVVGVNWKASIMPLKFLSGSGSGTDVDAAAAINYSVLHGARASNNSWGGGGSDLIFNAINAARTADFGGGKIGQVFIAAAGNNGQNSDVNPTFPGAYNLANIISVAATDSSGQLASFSNFGPNTIKVAGPGVSVYSTIPNNSYAFFSGTSMATPHVTGIVGLLLTQDPSLTATAIVGRVVNTTTPDTNLSGKITTAGIANAANALAPAVLSETPAPGASGVPVDTTVKAVFSKSVQAATISFTLQDTSGNLVAASLAYNDATRTATLTPAAPLASGATYVATISGAKDLFGTALVAPVTWSFSTGTVVPTITSKTPAAGATNVPTNTTITATFSESVAVNTIKFTLQDATGKLVPAALAYNDATHTATLSPATLLATATTYTAMVSGATDVNGNVMVPVIWSFTTEAAPAVTGETPAPSATNVATNGTVTATFNKSVVASTIAFTLKNAAGNPVSATLTYNDTTHTASLKPSTLLATNATYTATISAAQDSSGNLLAAPVSWSFTTEAAPAVTSVTPAPGATGIPLTYTVTATFNKSVVASTIAFTLKDPAGNAVSATLAYNDATHVATLTPTAALAPLTTYTATVSAAQDASGNPLAAPVAWSFTTANLIPAVTAMAPAAGATNVPTNVAVTATFNESVTASTIAFTLKDAAGTPVSAAVAYNDATHTATLTPTKLLTTATTYTATVSGATDVNGNVMVPVSWSFTTEATPAVTSESPAPGATGVPLGTTVTATFNKSVVSSSIAFTLKNAAGNSVSATLTYNDTTHGATLTPSAPLAPNATYTATVSAAKDASGNSLAAAVTWSFTTGASGPVVIGKTPAAGATNVPINTTITATFNDSVELDTILLTLQDSAGNLVTTNFAWDDTTHTATWTPTTLLAIGTTYTATVSGAKDINGNVMVPVTWSFTAAPAFSIWSPNAAPTLASDPDAAAVEVGVKFRSDSSGLITGLRFYKGVGNTGTHVGHLWTSTGVLLATATFTGESTTGWQQVNFAIPVAINPNVTYVASYHTNVGHYAADLNYFAGAGVDNAPLHALKDGVDGGNGVFAYGVASAFPNQTFLATNYWVDVVFTPTNVTVPAVISQLPAPGATSVAPNATVKATFNESVVASSISFVLKDAAGNPVTATIAYDDPSQTVTLTPSKALANSTTYTATISGAKDAAGNGMPNPVSWSFTTAAASSGPFSIFAPTATPTNPADPDPAAVEVGVKFQSDVAGQITGIRFYKGVSNTGIHVANLWAADGTLLASATFTSETASGWQTVTFSTPVTISANTTYIASYHTNVGHYADDQNFFVSSVDNAPLHALADGASGGNGVYAYGLTSSFPTKSWNASNYWVDVVFVKT
jgi:subtilisin family serine protease